MSSIRRFLVIYILLATALITSLSAIGDYFLGQTEIRAHMDALLQQMGLSFAVMISNNLNTSNYKNLQSELILLQSENRYFAYISPDSPQKDLAKEEKYYFQLWNDQGKLLLYSTDANRFNLNVAPAGFSDININNRRWRIFKIYDAKKQRSYIVGEHYSVRDGLLHRIAQNNFYIMLLIYPIAGLLIWVIVGCGFKSLQRITNELSNRALTHHLDPIDTHHVPLEVKPLIDELNRLFSRLHEAFEREKRFAADAAHELRTPLAALKTQAQVALKIFDPQEKQALLENFVGSVDRIVHIVQQLLILSRLVPESVTAYEMIEVNLPKLTAEVIAQLVPMAIEKDIEIALEAPSSPLLIKGNVAGLSILLRNLVDNALRYTPEKGHVKVEIFQEEKYIILCVSDTGPGIPEELWARVFERFYRIIGTNTSGSGLGLAIVEQIVKLHAASISLENNILGQGLKIKIRFLSYSSEPLMIFNSLYP